MIKLAVKVFTRTAVRSATKSAMWYGIFAVGRSVGRMNERGRWKQEAEGKIADVTDKITEKLDEVLYNKEDHTAEDKIADPRVEVQYKGKKK